MTKARLEAFSDGVLAVIITVMVLEIKHPDGPTLHAIVQVLPSLGTYTLSFLYAGIYWNNHHHMLQLCKHVTGGVLWANLHLLFWLSLVPPVTAWISAFGFQPLPVAVYAFLQLMAGIAYYILEQTLIRVHGKGSALAKAIGYDLKGKMSVVGYLVAISLAWASPVVACFVMVAVALSWLIPDRRIEHAKGHEDHES